ncbi:MAG: YifB family Mg chelatase-like AAA ATPase [Bilifractor sp.]
MATLVKSFSISGSEAYPVDIEVKTMDGMPSITVIGLGDQAVKEAAERVESAIDESGYTFPKKRVIISLAPSDLKKSGSHFDLAMAIGVLQQEESICAKSLKSYGLMGELALDGSLRACRGVLPMVIAAKKNGVPKVIVPRENLQEASLVHGIGIYGFDSLTDVIRFLEGKSAYVASEIESVSKKEDSKMDFSDVKGQDDLINAIVLAAAGGHNLLMIGEPGCGKTMVAQRIPTILPEMSEAESLEVTKIYSISGLLSDRHALIKSRPFRAPHHNASLNALIGGGANAMPGEVSLAHNGVLFLDELAEFPKRTLDALRQPVEDKKVCISRVNGTHTFPSNFMFVTAMNPCPCGYFPGKKCTCTDYEIIKYRNRISGPIMDRIDIQKSVRPVNFFEASETERKRRTSAELRAVVECARKIQQERYKNEEAVYCNAQMTTSLMQRYCGLDHDSLELLKTTSEAFGYSARTIHKLLRLARTSADIDGVPDIRSIDIQKVLRLRDLDKSNSSLLVVKSAKMQN